MLFNKIAGSIAGLTLATVTFAEPPRVVTDIAPIHSLVSQVMDGVAEPSLLIKPENSPHEYTLRPSEARALSNADVVFWIGSDLTPWLEKSLESLADSAQKVSLLETEGLTFHGFREGATFEAHAHDDHPDDHGEHDGHHDEHDEHHDEHGEHHDDHEEEHDDHHGHDHEGNDPHAWLDPVNAQIWVKQIAEVLAKEDPANAKRYQANADSAITRLETLVNSNQAKATQLAGIKFIVFHDAYQYFERRFGVLATGALSVSDASDPSPARVAEIRKTVADLGVTCVFTEPQYNPNMVKSVFKSTKVVTKGVMDPIGASIKPGANQYYELINNLMTSLSHCKPRI